MKWLEKLLAFAACWIIALWPSALLAQSQDIAMADELRASGKIYVVVAVVLVILLGLLFYLFTTDRRLTKLEKETQAR
jgi:CcmD family protein